MIKSSKLASGAAAILLGGCAYWTAPLTSKVVDDVSRLPIAGAQVTAWPTGRDAEAKTFVTDANGQVTIPGFKFFMALPGDPGLAWPVAFRAEAAGYNTFEFKESDGTLETDITIELTPAGGSNE